MLDQPGQRDLPNYRQLLPDSHPNRVIFPKDAVLAAIARAELVAEDHIPIRLKLTKQGAHLTVKRQDVGEETELIPGEMEGEEDEIDVAFNPAYIRDGVSAIEADTPTPPGDKPKVPNLPRTRMTNPLQKVRG